MEPIWLFPLFFGRVFALALLLVGIGYSITGRTFFSRFAYDFIVASVLGFWLLLLDSTIIYPRLRSPLRKLPLVQVSFVDLTARNSGVRVL